MTSTVVDPVLAFAHAEPAVETYLDRLDEWLH